MSKNLQEICGTEVMEAEDESFCVSSLSSRSPSLHFADTCDGKYEQKDVCRSKLNRSGRWLDSKSAEEVPAG